MGVVTVRRRVCDICGKDVDIKSYKLAFVEEGEQRSLDLCKTHGQPLEAIRAAVPVKRGRPASRQVVTQKQVRAARRTTTKKASKKA